MSKFLHTFQYSTALITGASSGIGQAYAQKFAAMGINVILVARSLEKLNALAKDLHDAHHIKVDVVVMDLAQAHAAEALLAEIQSRKLTVEILVNNAGFGKWSKFLDQPVSTYHEMLTLNINTLTSLCALFIPPMLAAKKGLVINVASTAAFHALPYIAVYGASKSYVLHFTEALAGEYTQSGVKILAVCPGNTATNFTQVANANTEGMKSASVEDVVSATLRALDKDKTTVIVGCQNYFMSQLPRILPRKKMLFLTEGVLKSRVK